MWSFAFNSDLNHSEQLSTGHRQKHWYVVCFSLMWRPMFILINSPQSGHLLPFIHFHCFRIGFSSAQKSRHWSSSVSKRGPGHKARSKWASGDQRVMSTAGPSDNPTWWRKSIRTMLSTGGSKQSRNHHWDGMASRSGEHESPQHRQVGGASKPAVRRQRIICDTRIFMIKSIQPHSIPVHVFGVWTRILVNWRASFVDSSPSWLAVETKYARTMCCGDKPLWMSYAISFFEKYECHKLQAFSIISY